MAGFNGSGTFVRTFNWVTDKSNSVKVTASRMDTEDDGFATGLSNTITKDGQQTTTAAIPFAGGAVKLSDGSAGTPGISFINDTDCGLYRIGANNVGLSVAGTKIIDYATATISVAVAVAIAGTLAITGGITGSTSFDATASAAVINSTGVVNAGTTVQQAGADLIPAGVIVPYGGASAPTGWLLCDGSSKLRASFAALFTAIGTTYGSADGSHFTLPDLTGRVPAGKEASATRLTSGGGGVDGGTLGAVGGTQTHTLTLAQSAAHDHGGATGNDSPDHTHSYSQTNVDNLSVQGPFTPANEGATTQQTGGASTRHTHTIASAGSGGAHPNVQPTLIVNYIIKT
jgi:microcystin-dependent protein